MTSVRISIVSVAQKANFLLHNQNHHRMLSTMGSRADVVRDLGEAANRLAEQIDRHVALPMEPIKADPYVLSSLLQKSIRRGDRQVAQRAAIILSKMRGAAIWRRLLVIAFEDVGVGSIETLTTTVVANSDPVWRQARGGDVRVAAFVADALAAAVKDRSTDYLGVAKEHPGLKDFASVMASKPLEDQLSWVQDQALSLPQRAVAASYAWGFSTIGCNVHNLGALMALFRGLGAPDVLVAATEIAARRTLEPIIALVPLIWLAANSDNARVVSACGLPESRSSTGIPLYAFDKHTRLGKHAIRELVRCDAPLRSCLREWVPEQRWQAASEMAAFYTDAAPVARRLEWSRSRDLEVLGKEADFAKLGVPLAAIGPVQTVMATSLARLNDIRESLWLKASGSR